MPLKDPITLEDLDLDESKDFFVVLDTSKGSVRMKVNQSTYEDIGRNGFKTESLSNPDLYNQNKFWGSYYGKNPVGEVTGDFVREVLDNSDNTSSVRNLALNVFFDDDSILSSNYNPEGRDNDCDCNCNCNCNCSGDCNCDCNCG